MLIFLPAIALVFSLVQERNRTLAEIATSSSALYALLIIASAVTFMNRERARQWLDQRFFREEYDARKILLSLASRVRFETDPADLATMVVNQLDEALHPLMTAILVSGIDEGRLSPVTVLHGSAEPLPLEGGLVSMLRWSDEPLEIVLSDPRSPARRLPPEEREWLECTGAVLLVPVVGQDRVAHRGDRARRAPVRRGLHRRGSRSCSPASPRRCRSGSTSCGCGGASAATSRTTAIARASSQPWRRRSNR